MQNEPSGPRGGDTRERLLDVAIEVLGTTPDARMGDVASAAGVVRRTVYGYFPTRSDLLVALARRAVSEIAAVLAEDAPVGKAADVAWADFIARLWPMTHRYRVLVVLRRGEFGEGIHALLGDVEQSLADLVERGQRSGAFGRHLPAGVLSQAAWSAVFTIADDELSRMELDVSAVILTSLLMLGVPESRAKVLAEQAGRA
ncbi:TetR/AcrR family transcriptional regulator [Cellulomonas sp. Leaf395]|uniref:TetR/AcrR family transcriptional regulator n=1 Tax=Cellulomonas sp. Leaf395 TaxID=1736362 RepID=UPI0006F4814E|nr:TetR/AcrR family transcriptional regulator [Cellulomonas sp. Leaf395]KQT01851.1 TetR family transcriptional regulator [Cellulomonas sp. Leaf395]